MNLSFTPNEIIARRVVDKLCRRPPYGQSWREFAVKEISSALTIAAARLRQSDQRSGAQSCAPRSSGGLDAAASG
jgi:hypothetical protein